MFGLGPTEILVITIVIIGLFGAKRLPEIARSLGRGIREFKQEIRSPLTQETQQITRDHHEAD